MAWVPWLGTLTRAILEHRPLSAGLKYLGSSALAMCNREIQAIQAIGSWAKCLGLGTQATSNPEIQAIGSWAKYLGLGALALVPWRRAIQKSRLLAAGLGT